MPQYLQKLVNKLHKARKGLAMSSEYLPLKIVCKNTFRIYWNERWGLGRKLRLVGA